MEFLYRNATPSYKGMNVQPRATSGLFASLLGGATPSYKTVDGNRAYAQASSRSWWQAFVTTPSYKTAPMTVQAAQSCQAPADNGGGEAETRCVCAPEDATQIVILE